MIKCLPTGRIIPTGIEADRAGFKFLPVVCGRTYCPWCRATHEWLAEDAWVAELASAPSIAPDVEIAG